jgi:hypothetical protein
MRSCRGSFVGQMLVVREICIQKGGIEEKEKTKKLVEEAYASLDESEETPLERLELSTS